MLEVLAASSLASTRQPNTSLTKTHSTRKWLHYSRALSPIDPEGTPVASSNTLLHTHALPPTHVLTDAHSRPRRGVSDHLDRAHQPGLQQPGSIIPETQRLPHVSIGAKPLPINRWRLCGRDSCGRTSGQCCPLTSWVAGSSAPGAASTAGGRKQGMHEG